MMYYKHVFAVQNELVTSRRPAGSVPRAISQRSYATNEWLLLM